MILLLFLDILMKEVAAVKDLKGLEVQQYESSHSLIKSGGGRRCKSQNQS